MQQITFTTYIEDNGLLKIPDKYKLSNRKVRVSIELVDTQTSEMKKDEKTEKVKSFLNKWTGFLKDADPDEAKFQYLSEKYK